MKATIVILIAGLVGIINSGCKNEMTKDPYAEAPYPSPDRQREALANKAWVPPVRILDSTQIIQDLEYLASAECAGRMPGTAGHAKAMERILFRMRAAGLDSFDNSLIQVFNAPDSIEGQNIIGWIRGTTYPEQFIVISAHYDHLGKDERGGIFYGADDNASGAACLLALAAYFKKNVHPYSLIFAAFDKEEMRFEGARYFVKDRFDKRILGSIKCNLNLDMIARSDHNEIFVSGTFYTPAFVELVKQVQEKTNVRVLIGHDGIPPESDWTNQGDHFAFRERFIPFLYIGVEDHPDYHHITDTYDRIAYTRYIENCNMIALLAEALHPW